MQLIPMTDWCDDTTPEISQAALLAGRSSSGAAAAVWRLMVQQLVHHPLQSVPLLLHLRQHAFCMLNGAFASQACFPGTVLKSILAAA